MWWSVKLASSPTRTIFLPDEHILRKITSSTSSPRESGWCLQNIYNCIKNDWSGNSQYVSNTKHRSRCYLFLFYWEIERHIASFTSEWTISVTRCYCWFGFPHFSGSKNGKIESSAEFAFSHTKVNSGTRLPAPNCRQNPEIFEHRLKSSSSVNIMRL